MKATQILYNLGQSIWLDNISRDLLESGALQHYIDEFSVSGVTSNPTIFERAIKNSTAYDEAIAKEAAAGRSREEIFIRLALEDLTRAANALLPSYERTNGVDGWVSLEVPPELAYDPEGTVRAARELYTAADCLNLFIKVPGTKQGLIAIEELIYSGVPINVTLLFCREHYIGAANAFMHGIERRLEAGLNPDVASVASVFVSRWDAAANGKVRSRLRNQLGIMMAKRTYRAARAVLTSAPMLRICNAGARAQRLVWASTGSKGADTPEIHYVKALVAPYSVNTMPEDTLLALSKQSRLDCLLPTEGADCEHLLEQFVTAGIDLDKRAAELQDEGVVSFRKSWNRLMAAIGSRMEISNKAPVATDAWL